MKTYLLREQVSDLARESKRTSTWLPPSAQKRGLQIKNRNWIRHENINYWLTVLAGYYLAVVLHDLEWVYFHGGYAAHNLPLLIARTLRTSTVNAGMLLGVMFIIWFFRDRLTAAKKSATIIQSPVTER